jgi:hypothetical protein
VGKLTEARGTQRSQEKPGGRSSKEEPGGARRSQEEPGGARRSQVEIQVSWKIFPNCKFKVDYTIHRSIYYFPEILGNS